MGEFEALVLTAVVRAGTGANGTSCTARSRHDRAGIRAFPPCM
jgi:hypothetical protein